MKIAKSSIVWYDASVCIPAECKVYLVKAKKGEILDYCLATYGKNEWCAVTNGAVLHVYYWAILD